MTSRRYPPTIGSNVRDIVDLIRKEVSARTLGHTTIRVGEGAITLRSADGKTVLGQLGHLPNGQMGFSMYFRGAVQDIRNGFAEDSERISAVDRKAIKNADDIGKVGTWASNAQTTANVALSTANDAQAGVSRVGVWATNAQSTANDANNNANAAHGRIDAVDQKAVKNAADIGKVGGWASNAQSTANAAQATADTAVSRANSAQSAANNAWDRAGTGIAAANGAAGAAQSAHNRADAAYALAAAAMDRANAAYAKASGPPP